MQKLEFNVSTEKELIKAIIDELPFLSRFQVEKMIKNKDVKVNNARVHENLTIKVGDKVTVFYSGIESKEWFTLIYADENVLIVNKRAGIEVVSEKERDLVSILKKSYCGIKPVHRIDRNTEGLVVFALNDQAETSLLSAFKTRNGIVKKYALKVHGRVDLTKIKRTIYLKKIENLSKVWVSEIKTSGYDKATTIFDVVQYFNDETLLQATLVTGKTHQIRAHISYYGYSIVGDQKYGKDDEKTMCLTANYLGFNFDKKDFLSYMNGKSFEIVPSWL